MHCEIPMLDAASDDDPSFLKEIFPVIKGALKCYEPDQVYLIKIDNWFDSKWAWFGGKVLGALGIHTFAKLVIPPFVPNRVKRQTYLVKSAKAPHQFDEQEAEPLHIEQASSNNFGRALKQNYSSAVFIWYSGNTLENRRGSLMVYWVKDGMAFGWHAALKEKEKWMLGKTTWIPRADVLRMANL